MSLCPIDHDPSNFMVITVITYSLSWFINSWVPVPDQQQEAGLKKFVRNSSQVVRRSCEHDRSNRRTFCCSVSIQNNTIHCCSVLIQNNTIQYIVAVYRYKTKQYNTLLQCICSKPIQYNTLLQCIKSRTICLRVKRRTGNKLGEL